MKKLLLLLPFLFLFFQKINGQVAPRLVKKVTEVYVDTLDRYVERKHELYEYDDIGNEVFYTTILFTEDGEYDSWRQIKSGYNEKGLLEKETIRRYNWEVNIWVNERWKEYVYDEDDCLVEEYFIENQVTVDEQFLVYQSGADCFPLSAEGYRIVDDSTALVEQIEMQYDLFGNLLYENRVIWALTGFDTFKIITIQMFNDQNDLTSQFVTYDFGGGSSILSGNSIYEYDYQFENNLLIAKSQNFFIVNGPPQDTTLRSVVDINYRYSCDELVLQEDRNRITYYTSGNVSSTRDERTHYFYEGENPCFNSYNRTYFPVKVFPNPATSFVQLKSLLFESGNTEIKIVDVNGRVVLGKNIDIRTSEVSVDVGNLPNGTYIIQLTSGEIFISKKLIILK